MVARSSQRRRGGRRARTFAFVGSCTSTSSSLDFSALSAGAVQAGDLLVYIDGSRSGAAPGSVTPSGFTNGLNDAGVTFRGMISGKKAAGGEAAVTGMSGSFNSKIGLVFRPSKPFTSFSMLDTATEINASNPASQSCDPSAETTAAIVVGVADSFGGGNGAFSTFSPAADSNVTTADNDMDAGYKIYNTNPQATAIDMNDLGNNWLASLYFTAT